MDIYWGLLMDFIKLMKVNPGTRQRLMPLYPSFDILQLKNIN